MLRIHTLGKFINRSKNSLFPILILPFLFLVILLRFHGYSPQLLVSDNPRENLIKVDIIQDFPEKSPQHKEIREYLNTSITEETRGKNILNLDLAIPKNSIKDLIILLFELLCIYFLQIDDLTFQLFSLRAPPAKF